MSERINLYIKDVAGLNRLFRQDDHAGEKFWPLAQFAPKAVAADRIVWRWAPEGTSKTPRCYPLAIGIVRKVVAPAQERPIFGLTWHSDLFEDVRLYTVDGDSTQEPVDFHGRQLVHLPDSDLKYDAIDDGWERNVFKYPSREFYHDCYCETCAKLGDKFTTQHFRSQRAKAARKAAAKLKAETKQPVTLDTW